LIIGRGGKGVEDLTKAIDKNLKNLFRKGDDKNKKIILSINIEEIKRSEVSSPYVAQQIAWDLEKRMPFRRTIKKYLDLAMQNREVQGIKIKLSGRLDGSEIARREWLGKGKLPLSTLRANIDYGEAVAFNSYGTVGIKVWVYKGEVFQKKVT
jgi:small subunit ribosomal protein S3